MSFFVGVTKFLAADSCLFFRCFLLCFPFFQAGLGQNFFQAGLRLCRSIENVSAPISEKLILVRKMKKIPPPAYHTKKTRHNLALLQNRKLYGQHPKLNSARDRVEATLGIAFGEIKHSFGLAWKWLIFAHARRNANFSTCTRKVLFLSFRNENEKSRRARTKKKTVA